MGSCSIADLDAPTRLMRLEEAGMVPSMRRAGSALDNAISKSFVASLKIERLHRHHFLSREAAKTAIFDYIELFYNRYWGIFAESRSASGWSTRRRVLLEG